VAGQERITLAEFSPILEEHHKGNDVSNEPLGLLRRDVYTFVNLGGEKMLREVLCYSVTKPIQLISRDGTSINLDPETDAELVVGSGCWWINRRSV
jgi:hypothetical protein